MNKQDKHPPIIQLIHWLSAILIIGLFALGIWMVELSYYDEWYQPAPNIHKSLGICLFFMTLVRVLAKTTQAKPEPIQGIAKWQNKMADLTHLFMYFCTFVILISGYLISTASGKPVSVFDWFSLPAIFSYGDTQADSAGLIHQYAAYLLIAIVVLHIAAFIQHQFFYKDQIIKRITPLK
ncbi:cytochrome b [Catenovulum sp. 2E275]|uniref:cytochrome b n=1 Tax=Catenovulum sp. 2E275 TaxID=2980497 RepID=UPI0021D202BD|nr:cytochrome b [Catenovulum sp. 2E275]MCU4675504.1 cytochrome b [Catenovulum sp. 2E275]